MDQLKGGAPVQGPCRGSLTHRKVRWTFRVRCRFSHTGEAADLIDQSSSSGFGGIGSVPESLRLQLSRKIVKCSLLSQCPVLAFSMSSRASRGGPPITGVSPSGEVEEGLSAHDPRNIWGGMRALIHVYRSKPGKIRGDVRSATAF